MDDQELKDLLGPPTQVEDPRVEDNPAPEPQAQVEATPEPAAEAPARGPDGKFVAKTQDPAPAPVEPGHVPISAMLDEREKRQALEKQLRDLQAQREPPPPLEPAEQLQAALYAQNLKVSRKFAERQYGAEMLAQVHDWAVKRCDEDPHFNQQMRLSDDPYEAAMQAFNRERVLETVKPGDLDAFRAWQAAQAQAQAAQAAPTPQPASAPPPRSLATAPGNGSAGKLHIPVGEGEAFQALFRQ